MSIQDSEAWKGLKQYHVSNMRMLNIKPRLGVLQKWIQVGNDDCEDDEWGKEKLFDTMFYI